MALDSATKRRNTFRFPNVVLPVPDGTIGAADRAHLIWVFGGNAWSSPTPTRSEGHTTAYHLFRDKRAKVLFRDKRGQT